MDMGQVLTRNRPMYQNMPCYATRLTLTEQSRHLYTAGHLYQRRTVVHMCGSLSLQGAEGYYVGRSPKPSRICMVTLSAEPMLLASLS